jgi:peptidoglycan/xylan/chitin deacetylase (PgdA/CDA1 family)
MKISLGFHDVVEQLSMARPIAPGHTTVYTLELRHVKECLAAIQSCSESTAVRTVDGFASNERREVFLTFDDGALSTFTCVAPELEKLGWRGHFFVTVNWIGCAGFLDRQQIRELHRRGHVIGSHSCSHPERMSSLGWAELVREWRDSCSLLGDLVGQSITVASVPGGYYSPKVARAAAVCGVKVLFTSEPTARVFFVDGCRVLGRYSVRSSMSASEVAAIATGAKLPRWEQASAWLGKKIAKQVMGPWYIPLRRVLANRSFGC